MTAGHAEILVEVGAMGASLTLFGRGRTHKQCAIRVREVSGASQDTFRVLGKERSRVLAREIRRALKLALRLISRGLAADGRSETRKADIALTGQTRVRRWADAKVVASRP